MGRREEMRMGTDISNRRCGPTVQQCARSQSGSRLPGRLGRKPVLQVLSGGFSWVDSMALVLGGVLCYSCCVVSIRCDRDGKPQPGPGFENERQA